MGEIPSAPATKFEGNAAAPAAEIISSLGSLFCLNTALCVILGCCSSLRLAKGTSDTDDLMEVIEFVEMV